MLRERASRRPAAGARHAGLHPAPLHAGPPPPRRPAAVYTKACTTAAAGCAAPRLALPPAPPALRIKPQPRERTRCRDAPASVAPARVPPMGEAGAEPPPVVMNATRSVRCSTSPSLSTVTRGRPLDMVQSSVGAARRAGSERGRVGASAAQAAAPPLKGCRCGAPAARVPRSDDLRHRPEHYGGLRVCNCADCGLDTSGLAPGPSERVAAGCRRYVGREDAAKARKSLVCRWSRNPLGHAEQVISAHADGSQSACLLPCLSTAP